VIAGHVNAVIMGPSVALSSVKDGKLKMLAFGSEKRVPQFPDVPTIAETVPGYEASVSFGLFTAAGTPTDIIKKVNADVQKIVSDPNSRRSISNASRCSRYPVRSKPLPNIYARIRLNGARSSIWRTLRSNECSRASRFGLSGIDLGKHHEQRSFALLALEKRIAIIPDNTRQLVEQAAAFSGAFPLKNSTRLFSPGLKLRHPPASGRIAVGCTSTKPSPKTRNAQLCSTENKSAKCGVHASA